jgi:hypothetical protein
VSYAAQPCSYLQYSFARILLTQSIQLSKIVRDLLPVNRYALWSALELMLKHQNPADCCATRILMFEQVSNIAFEELVELNGIEPLTPCLQSRCSPS